MPDLKLTPITPGRLNKPAWYRSHTAQLGPARKTAGEYGSVMHYDVYLDDARIGSVTGTPKTRPARPGSEVLVADGTLRIWRPDRLVADVKQHGVSRFEAVDALVRSHLAADTLKQAA